MAAAPTITAAYIAASANRYPHAADCQGSIVAFGSHNHIALWNIEVC